MATTTPTTDAARVAQRFRTVRRRTMSLCQPLTPEDMMVQSCPEASPAKWHLAHTAWFFESFVLREFVPGYSLFNPDFAWLFNSYYQTFAAFPEKRLRSSFSRPGLEEVMRFRAHVDEGIERLLEGDPDPEAVKRIELGANHEEQHQELLLTDILHAFFTNPLRPAYEKQGTGDQGTEGTENRERGNEGPRDQGTENPEPVRFLRFDGGMREAGHAGDSFCFDNELPRHRVWLEPYGLAERLVTCGEYARIHPGRRLPASRALAQRRLECHAEQRLARAALLDQRIRRLAGVYPARHAAHEPHEKRAGKPGELL